MTQDYTKNEKQKPKRAPRASNDELDFDHPPRGVAMERTPDGGVVITSRIFSGATVFFTVFALFWNGITSVFVCSIVGMTLAKFGIDTPFGGITMEGSGEPASLVFLWLFITPFILVGIGTALFALRGIFGKCVITVCHDAASVRTGVGFLARTQHFSPQSIKRVGWHSPYSQNNTPVYHLLVEMNNGRQIKLPGFNNTRMAWIAHALGIVLGRPVEEKP